MNRGQNGDIREEASDGRVGGALVAFRSRERPAARQIAVAGLDRRLAGWGRSFRVL
jgi:hypothetical protein